jgi:hypothetical protein
MAYYGPGPYYGDACGPCGPYGPVPGPCGPPPCGPCGPLVSGVGKCFPPPVLSGGAQELALWPMTGSPTGTQTLYSNNTRNTTTITSFIETGSGNNWTETVLLNLANVRSACSVTGTLTVVPLTGTLGNRNYTATTTIAPFSTTATLVFAGLPATTNGTLTYLHLTYA